MSPEIAILIALWCGPVVSAGWRLPSEIDSCREKLIKECVSAPTKDDITACIVRYKLVKKSW